MGTMLDLIMKRRSIRAFTGEPVAKERLIPALRAAMAAPSANNRKPWQFAVLTQEDAIRSVCEAHPYAKFGVNAGAVILPFGEKEGYKWFDQDMAAATENLLLALADEGLGATWCGMDDAKQNDIRPLLGLPDGLYVFALIPVGVPAVEAKPRTQFEETRIHWDGDQR